MKDVVQYEDVCASYVNGACESYVTVPRADSWITEEQFFAGLGVVQVRLFSFPYGQLD